MATLYPYPVTALAVNDSVGTGGNNTIASVTIAVYDLNDNVVTLYDDENSLNPEATKTTGADGKVIIWLEAGRYRVTFDGGSDSWFSVGAGGGVKVNPLDFGATADGATDDYSAFNDAIQSISGSGTLFIQDGNYAVNSPLTVPRGINIEFESERAKIIYGGSGYCFNFIASDRTDISTYYKFIQVTGGRIEDGSGGTADGAIYFNGAYLVEASGEIFGFEKSGAIGCRARNVFNFTYSKGLINTITNGIGLSVEGDSDAIQVTNVKIGDNLLIQRCDVDIDISTEKQAQSIEIGNMALQLADSGTAINVSGNVANLTVGCALHVECYAVDDTSNSSTFFKVSDGAEVRTLNIDGVDIYNTKTLFDIDASNTSIVSDVEIDNIYTSAQNVTSGVAFILKDIINDLYIGSQNIDGSKYTLFDISGCQPTFLQQSLPESSLPTNAGFKGLSVALTDKTVTADRDFERVFDGSQWYRRLYANAAGVIRATGDIQWADQRRVAIVSSSPEGSLTAANGSLALEDDGRVWKKGSGGFTSTGWVQLTAFISATASELGDIADSINTIDKYSGKLVFDSTNGYYVYASAPTAGASWNRISTDAAVITPA